MDNFCSQAYTSKGLVSLKSRAADIKFTYIMKGYPDSLKRFFLKKLLTSADSCFNAAYDYNNSPVCLYCREKNFQIVDGTYPLTAEPETYGITDTIIDLSAFQNLQKLTEKRDIAANLFKSIKKEEKRCRDFISAAKGISDDCRRHESQYIDRSSLNRFASRLWKRYGTPPSGRVGTETKYFADALSGYGMSFNFEKFSSMCKTVSVINDFSSVVSVSVADKIRLYALSSGFDVISFVDFLDAETVRHVIIPELEYGIYSARFSEDGNFENCRKIRKSRFLSRESSEYIKNRSSFCKKAYSEFISEAANSIKAIENLKNRLDKIYLSATDINRFIFNNEQKVTGIDKSLQKVYNGDNCCI